MRNEQAGSFKDVSSLHILLSFLCAFAPLCENFSNDFFEKSSRRGAKKAKDAKGWAL